MIPIFDIHLYKSVHAAATSVVTRIRRIAVAITTPTDAISRKRTLPHPDSYFVNVVMNLDRSMSRDTI